MNAKLNFATPSSILTIGAATLAAVIAMTVLWAVVSLFQSRGAPMERLAAAERACVQHAYQSEREACMKQWIAESRAIPVASQ
jgi:sugar phosphate permease